MGNDTTDSTSSDSGFLGNFFSGLSQLATAGATAYKSIVPSAPANTVTAATPPAALPTGTIAGIPTTYFIIGVGAVLAIFGFLILRRK